jgi:hypothetical protein
MEGRVGCRPVRHGLTQAEPRFEGLIDDLGFAGRKNPC